MSSLLLITAIALIAVAIAAGLAYRARVNGPFEPTNYIWFRGLGLLCDKNGGLDFLKRQRGSRESMPLDLKAYADIQEGDLVWVRHLALPQFAEHVLPTINARFGLVSGDEDWGIPSGFSDADRILENKFLVHWFTQNYDGTDTSGKISGLPLGLDFHTVSNRRKWGHWPMTPTQQEAQLVDVVAHMPPTATRTRLVHADFHLNKFKKQIWGEGRIQVEAVLRSNDCVYFEQRKLRRLDSWKKKTTFAFEVSPHGNGLDCLRTWESLVLGNIVIVKRSSLDPLYTGLPVVILDDWSEITQDNLDRWLQQHAAALDDPAVQERLTNGYWMQHMRRVMRSLMNPASRTLGDD
jgi:hypothetical protein